MDKLSVLADGRTTLPWLSAPSVWAAPLVTALIIFGWSSILGGVSAEPYTDGVLARAGVGFQYGLPIAAGAAAWAARRSRALTPPATMRTRPRSALRVMLAHLWPLVLGAYVGYLVPVLVMMSDLTAMNGFTLAVPAVHLSMIVASLSFGWTVGAFFPLPLAVPLAVVMAYQWAAYPLAEANNLSLRNITGYASFMCCDFVENRLDLRSVVAPAVLAIAFFIIALASVRVDARRLAIPALIILIGATSGAIGIAKGTTAMAATLRPQVDQVCSGIAPRVCLYPEVSPATRLSFVETLGQANLEANRHGVDLPQTIQAPASDNAADALVLYASSLATRDELLTSLARSLADSTFCATSSFPGQSTPLLPTSSEVPEEVVVTFVLAVLLGADLDAATPTFEIMPLGEEGAFVQQPSPSQVRSMLGIDSVDDAVVLAKNWYDAQIECEV